MKFCLGKCKVKKRKHKVNHDIVYGLFYKTVLYITVKHPPGSYDLTIRAWSIETGAYLRLWRGHRGTITCLDHNDT